MIYFITSRIDALTSAIELAEIRRWRMFKRLNQTATIISVNYETEYGQTHQRLGLDKSAINLFRYFQHLDLDDQPDHTTQLKQQLLADTGLPVSDGMAWADNGKERKARLKITTFNPTFFTASYYDHYGFLSHVDAYDGAQLSYTEYFEDRGRLVTRVYYNQARVPVMQWFYRGGKGNVPVLTEIQLRLNDKWRTFDNEAQLRAAFFDDLVAVHPHSVFLLDRALVLDAITLMRRPVPTYYIFHSAFTEDATRNGKIFQVYQPLTKMLANNQVNGMIASTEDEVADLKARFPGVRAYAIPVTYATRQQPVPFDSRQKYRILVVSRLDETKRVDDAVKVAFALKPLFPQLQMDVYGYHDGYNHNAATNKVKKMIADHNAGNYVHLRGYLHDLGPQYDSATLLLLTSRSEGFSMAVLEAQEHGCPVASYDINYGPNVIIKPHESGELVKSGDVKAMTETVRNMLNDRQWLRSASQAAYEAADKYSLGNVLTKWRDFMENEHLWQY